MAHLTPDLLEFVLRWLPAAPVRVLEVGCGDGALTRLLAERSYDVLGLDPDAPDEAGFRRSTLEELEPLPAFDAAVAIRSLHHLHDAERGLDNLRAALGSGARLVVFEYSIENVDGAAETWLREQGIPRHMTESHRREVIPLARLRDALERRFRPLVAEPVAYHAREAGREDLAAAEEDAIRSGRLLPAGMRLVFERP